VTPRLRTGTGCPATGDALSGNPFILAILLNPLDAANQCCGSIRIRIGLGFNRVPGSGSGSKRAKMAQKKNKSVD
jgi:hypothetical protein